MQMNNVFNPIVDEIINSRFKNIIVSGKTSSGKTSLALSLVQYLKDNNRKVLFCEFDREKYVLYGKDINLTTDVILKNALFSCSNCKSVNAFEENLDENTIVIIDNYDIASPSPYLRHLLTLKARFVVMTRCDMKKRPENTGIIVLSCNDEVTFEEIISALDEREYELLISLCCMLYYREPTTKIINSKSGVFDEACVKYYLGSLSQNLDALISKGLLNKERDGRIAIPRNVSDYVVKKIKPSLCQMPMFNKYLNGVEYEKNKHELLDLVTYFALNDEKILCDVLEIMLSNGVSDKDVSRLLNRNVAYFVNQFTNERLSQNIDLYSFCISLLKSGGISPCALSCLCTIILCTHNLVGKSADMYKANRAILIALKNAIDKILLFDKSEKEYVAKFAIKFCEDTLFYHSPLSLDGDYKEYRNDIKGHEITLFADGYYNEENANGLCFSYSPLTVEIYVSFQKLLLIFEDEYKEQIQNISVNFWRTVKGYDAFYDFFDNRYVSRVSSKDALLINDKVFRNNKRFLSRGFDGNTKIGSKRYAQTVVGTIKNSKRPATLVFLVINPKYRLCDYTYKNLLLLGFADVVAENNEISNLSKQDILETLVLNFDEDFSVYLKSFYLLLAQKLENIIVHNETSLCSLSQSVCRMYVINSLKNVSTPNCNELFDRFYHKANDTKTPEGILAKMLFDCKVNGKKPRDKAKAEKALNCVKKQYRMADLHIKDESYEYIKQMLKI